MKSLLILGAGGYGQLVKELAEMLGYDKIDFLDDKLPLAVGKLNDVMSLQDNYDEQIVAIGNSIIRQKYFSKINNPSTLIHPKSIIAKSAKIGKNVVIEANAVISSGTEIMDGSFICAGAVVNHNSVVDEFCQVDCNAVIGSFSKVARGTKVVSCSLWQDN